MSWYPTVAVIAMLVSPKNAQIEAQLADFQVTTRSLGRDQIVLNASTENEIDTANSGYDPNLADLRIPWQGILRRGTVGGACRDLD
jgi:hypothetical protein